MPIPARKIAVLIAASAQVFISGPSAGQGYPPAYPRPNATQIIDNDRINAWDVYWIKDKPTPLHTHVIDQFSITLQGGLIRVSPAGGPWGKAHMSQIGSVNFVPAGTTHREEGLSDIPQHKIMLEVKSSQPHPDSHGTSPGEGAAKVFENDRLVAWDITWKQGQQVARPRDDLDSVMVFLSGGTVSSTGDGVPTTTVIKPGKTVYIRHNSPISVENVLAGTPRAIIVELK